MNYAAAMIGSFSLASLSFQAEVAKKEEVIKKMKDSILTLHEEKDALRAKLEKMEGLQEMLQSRESEVNELREQLASLEGALYESKRGIQEYTEDMVNLIAIGAGFAIFIIIAIYATILVNSPLVIG